MSDQSYSCRYCESAKSQIQASGIRDWEYGVEGSWSYLKCETCGGIQLHPFPDLEMLQIGRAHV